MKISGLEFTAAVDGQSISELWQLPCQTGAYGRQEFHHVSDPKHTTPLAKTFDGTEIKSGLVQCLLLSRGGLGVSLFGDKP